MNKTVTLNQLIAELQKLAEEHGEKTIASIGSSCGRINGMNSPHCIRFDGDFNNTYYIAAYQSDVKE